MDFSRIGRTPLASLVVLLLKARLVAAGPTFTVTTPGDAKDAQIDGHCETAVGNHTCTLRAAVMEANATTGAMIVVPAGTYSLTVTPSSIGFNDASSGDLNITSSMTIQGAGSSKTFIDATTLGDRVFRIGLMGSLTISGVTIQNATSVYDAVTSSTALGGAFFVDSGTLNVFDSRITNCKALDPAEAFGGAIYSDGDVTLTRTRIDSCGAHASPFCGGGAILVNSGTLTLDRSTIDSCASDGPGGAIDLDANPNVKSVRIVASTLDGNSTLSDGGALAIGAGSCVIVNSTIAGNLADGNGGGIYNDGAASLFSSTVTSNHCDYDQNRTGAGGGVFNDTGGTFTFQNTIIAKNFDTSVGSVVPGDCSGTLTSNGNNIVYSLFYLCSVTPAATYIDPMLGSLQNAGGPTLTAPPQTGSQAIDMGNIGGCTDDLAVILTTDQRGVTRPIGGRCDIGAVEKEPIGDADGDGFVTVADVFYLINYLFAGGPVPLGRVNVNGDAATDVADVFYLVNYLFAGGPAPQG